MTDATTATDDALRAVHEQVLARSLGVRSDERLVIVSDPPMLPLALGMRALGDELAASSVLCVLSAERRGTDLPPAVDAALERCDVFVGLTSGSITHAPGRRAATARGARGVSMGGCDRAMLERLLLGDLDAVAQRSRAVAALLDTAGEARLTCPRGSDLTFDLRGRRGIPDDGDLTAPGAIGNLPFGEAYVSPLAGEGVLAPTTIAGQGRAAPGTLLHVRDGRLAAADDADGARLLATLSAHGDAGLNLAELGVGTHDRAALSGSILEDEKILGSVHVAFGASAAIGGTVAVPVHVDCVVLDATLHVGGQALLVDGVPTF